MRCVLRAMLRWNDEKVRQQIKRHAMIFWTLADACASLGKELKLAAAESERLAALLWSFVRRHDSPTLRAAVEQLLATGSFEITIGGILRFAADGLAPFMSKQTAEAAAEIADLAQQILPILYRAATHSLIDEKERKVDVAAPPSVGSAGAQ